jgi:hypothetical protein
MGIGAWIGAEIIVIFGAGLIYGAGSLILGWPEEISPGLRFLVYLLGLSAAIASVTIVRRILYSKGEEKPLPLPPPPPKF